MLRHRFKYDALPLVQMSEIQLQIKEGIEKKICDGIYKFEKLNCLFCGGNRFELLAEKDRYGLYMPVQICLDCGLIQTNPRMTDESYKEFYNCEYRKLYGASGKTAQALFEEEVTKGKSLYDIFEKYNLLKKTPQNSLVLEVGCGAGGTLKIFKDKRYNVKGLDLGEKYLEYGKKTYDLDLQYGDLASVKFEKAPDIIVYHHVFEHLLDPMAELEKIRKVIADDGILYINVPGVMSLSESNYAGDFLMFLQNAHICHFTLTTLNNMISKAGFKALFVSEYAFVISSKSELPEKDYVFKNDYQTALDYLNKLEKINYQNSKKNSGENTKNS